MERKLLAVCVCACMLGACATNDKAASDQRDEGAYVTGSRLPQKTTGTAPVSRTSQEDYQRDSTGKQNNPQGR